MEYKTIILLKIKQMKKQLLTLALSALTFSFFGQDYTDIKVAESQKKVVDNQLLISTLSKKIDSLKSENEKLFGDVRSVNSRISYVVGLGFSHSLDNTYQMPVVDANNNVKLELGQRERITATLGVVYTPYIYRITDNQHPEGFLAARGLSYVAFFNPLSILKNSNLEDNFSLGNFGLGAGYKTVSGIGIYGVFEMFSVNQPKKWFIDEYGSGDKTYTIGGNIQSRFNSEDLNIFSKKLIPAFSIKMCYSFDIIRSFAKAAKPE
jgi:hypothetical protein